MRNGVLSVVAGIFLGGLFLNGYAATTSIANAPVDVIKAVRKTYPDAVILAASHPCNLGEAKQDAFGLLINTSPKTSQDQKPLPIIIVKKEGAWDVNEVTKIVESSKAPSSDSVLAYQPDIRCITLPNAEPAISTEAHGVFVGPFAKSHDPQMKHLCFNADDTYNNWVCLAIHPTTKSPALSFIQINAD